MNEDHIKALAKQVLILEKALSEEGATTQQITEIRNGYIMSVLLIASAMN